MKTAESDSFVHIEKYMNDNAQSYRSGFQDGKKEAIDQISASLNRLKELNLIDSKDKCIVFINLVKEKFEVKKSYLKCDHSSCVVLFAVDKEILTERYREIYDVTIDYFEALNNNTNGFYYDYSFIPDININEDKIFADGYDWKYEKKLSIS